MGGVLAMCYISVILKQSEVYKFTKIVKNFFLISKEKFPLKRNVNLMVENGRNPVISRIRPHCVISTRSGEKFCQYAISKPIETKQISEEDLNLEGVEAPIMQDREDVNSMLPVIKNIQY